MSLCCINSNFLQHHRCNLKRQEQWLLQRQMKLEGGFQGRTNKLVDSCYSFWQGAALAIVEIIRRGGDDLSDVRGTSAESMREEDLEMPPRIVVASDERGELPFNQKALQLYILHCAQELEKGGLKGNLDHYTKIYLMDTRQTWQIQRLLPQERTPLLL